MHVRSLAGPLRLARDGETFDGSEEFDYLQGRRAAPGVRAPCPVTAPARGREWLRLRLDPAARYGLRVTLFAVAFALVAVPFGLLVSQVRGDGRLVDLDTAGVDRLHDWVRSSPGVVGPLKAVTDLGAPLWLWFVCIVATVVLVRAGRARLLVFLLVTVLVGSLLDTVVKIVVDRPRPFLLDPVASARGKSFPSGHAMSSTVVYGSLLLVFLPGGGPPVATGGWWRGRRPWWSPSGSPGSPSASTT